MKIGHPRYSTEEIVTRGKAIYDQQLRPKLEADHLGEYLVIDVESGEYELDKDGHVATVRAHAKHPGQPLYGMRIGYRAWGRLGAGIARKI